MYFITYVSSATNKFKEEELVQLLSHARRKNSTNNITGLLLYCDGDFIQTLEGDEADVKLLYQKIHNDPRHTCIIKIAEGYHAERKFSDWSMGFHRISSSELGAVIGHKEFDRKDLFKNLDMEDNHPAIIAIRSFYDSQPIYRKMS